MQPVWISQTHQTGMSTDATHHLVLTSRTDNSPFLRQFTWRDALRRVLLRDCFTNTVCVAEAAVSGLWMVFVRTYVPTFSFVACRGRQTLSKLLHTHSLSWWKQLKARFSHNDTWFATLKQVYPEVSLWDKKTWNVTWRTIRYWKKNSSK